MKYILFITITLIACNRPSKSNEEKQDVPEVRSSVSGEKKPKTLYFNTAFLEKENGALKIKSEIYFRKDGASSDVIKTCSKIITNDNDLYIIPVSKGVNKYGLPNFKNLSFYSGNNKVGEIVLKEFHYLTGMVSESLYAVFEFKQNDNPLKSYVRNYGYIALCREEAIPKTFNVSYDEDFSIEIEVPEISNKYALSVNKPECFWRKKMIINGDVFYWITLVDFSERITFCNIYRRLESGSLQEIYNFSSEKDDAISPIVSIKPFPFYFNGLPVFYITRANCASSNSYSIHMVYNGTKLEDMDMQYLEDRY